MDNQQQQHEDDLSTPKRGGRGKGGIDNNNNNNNNFSYLYASYFFAAWGDRMWEFAAIIFLMAIFPTTLFPSSFFGFCETVAGIAFGGTVGRFIDSTDRLKAVRVSIVGQNVAIFIASIIFVYSLPDVSSSSTTLSEHIRRNGNGNAAAGGEEGGSHNDAVFKNSHNLTIMLLIVLAGMCAKVASSLNKISIHKDWCVVCARGDSKTQTLLNSNMRRVDLTCSILAPLAVGALSSAFSPVAACKFIAIWSFLSIFAEFYLSQEVYSAIPALQAQKKKNQSSTDNRREQQNDDEDDDNDDENNEGVFLTYLKHPVFPISLPYCILYISLLSFGGIMVAFLRVLGCSDFLLATGRALAALVAIGSTFTVPSMISSMGLVAAGKLCSWLQTVALAPLAYVFLTTMSNPSEQETTMFIAVVFVSVCLSRFGLWAFDLVETQLMQESVDPAYAGRVNGAQDILMNFCYVISFTLTMVENDPRKFAGPALVSFGAVLLTSLLFQWGADDAFESAQHMLKKQQDARASHERATTATPAPAPPTTTTGLELEEL